ncbi:MAG: ABC transporter permease [Salinisphaera sp.]|jgi:simple sugar transport system permease protein|nr:ABC transporter permease [Salinisphaera sp.]
MKARNVLARMRGRNNEGIVALTIVVLALVVGVLNPGFLSWATVFNILRNSYVPVLFALGVLLVLVMGGIDVSFDAVGIFAGYASSVLVAGGHLPGHLWLMFVVSTLIGAGLGAFNALVVSFGNLSVLIVTLATRGIFAGIMLAFVGSAFISNLPESLQSFNMDYLVRTHTATGQLAGLQMLVVPVGIVCLLVALGLRFTVIGRGIYAIGGSEDAARRAGFPVGMIKTIVFCIAGALAGTAGMVHVSLIGFANPQDLVGDELIVIAAVVLGGASIFGGRGSVTGTVLGVLLIELIQYSLIILGVQSSWDDAAIGILLFIGIVLQVGYFPGTSGLVKLFFKGFTMRRVRS